ncbi:MAG: radical SAM/SPASM domain-containing protein [Desulfurellales bacterium]|nr:MAG: radical SAM/SPASM domain-containing protein [Desulfurellales bacterium]
MGITERIDAITRIDPRYRGTVLPAPRSVKIEITASCNYRCAFCVKSLRADNGEMDRAFYSRILREMRDAGVEELGVFYIGESFTCKWLPEAIAEAKAVGFPYVFLTTNGASATPERVKACMAAGLDSLKFSLNFTDDAQFAEIAQVSPRLYRKAIDNLKAARIVRDAGHFKCGLYASSIAFDGEQGEKMRRIVDEVRPHVDQHYWLPLYGMSGASKSAGWKPQPGNPGRLDAMRDPLPCWAVFTEGHITRDGKLAACCFGDGLDGGLLMADLNKVSFMGGWNSPAFQELRAAHLRKDVSGTACAECAAA